MVHAIKHPGFVSNAFSSLGGLNNGQLARELDGIGPVLYRLDALINERDCCIDELKNVDVELDRNRQHERRLSKFRRLASFDQAEEFCHVKYLVQLGQSRRSALKERIRIINRLIRTSYNY